MQGICNDQPCKAAYQGIPDLEHGAHHVALDGDRDGARCALPLEAPQRLCNVCGRRSGAPGVLQRLRELDTVLHSRAVRSASARQASCNLHCRCHTTLLVPAVQTRACPACSLCWTYTSLAADFAHDQDNSTRGPPTGQKSISSGRVWTTCSESMLLIDSHL